MNKSEYQWFPGPVTHSKPWASWCEELWHQPQETNASLGHCGLGMYLCSSWNRCAGDTHTICSGWLVKAIFCFSTALPSGHRNPVPPCGTLAVKPHWWLPQTRGRQMEIPTALSLYVWEEGKVSLTFLLFSCQPLSSKSIWISSGSLVPTLYLFGPADVLLYPHQTL